MGAMIAFQCPNCQRQFSVPDQYAGREARCHCRTLLKVPAVGAAPPLTSPAAPATPGLRHRRLLADAQAMRSLFTTDRPIRILTADGDPIARYVLELDITTTIRPDTFSPGPHRCELLLVHDYPKLPPLARMLSTVFHPNINASSICVGDHWSAGERLSDLVFRIAEMLAYQAYNIRSPLDAEAAMWADLNTSRLPTDPRDIRSLFPA
jgi:ubiquitin-protein ligase